MHSSVEMVNSVFNYRFSLLASRNQQCKAVTAVATPRAHPVVIIIIIIIILIIIIIISVNKNQIYSIYPIFIYVQLAFGGHCLHFQVYTINSVI